MILYDTVMTPLLYTLLIGNRGTYPGVLRAPGLNVFLSFRFLSLFSQKTALGDGCCFCMQYIAQRGDDMPRARNPNRDKAYQIYKSNNGKIDLVEIASQLNISAGTVRGWKSKDKWNQKLNGTFQKNMERSKRKNRKQEAVAMEVDQVIDNPDLTDKQRLFCLHYVRCFNATKAYQKAYECGYISAMQNGSRMLRNDKVKSEILRLKKERFNKDLLSEEDIFQKYMDIAFADITDYVSFGTEEVPVMAMHGPVEIEDEETGKKKILTKTVNTVRFKESDMVDGTLVSEVKQGKDGTSIKLMDRMKALNWLAEHMDMASKEQKARIEQIKAKTEQIRGADQNPVEDKVKKLFEAIGGALDESG